MKPSTLLTALCMATSTSFCFAQSFSYPSTIKQPVTDTYYHQVVVDNYRWLEDVNSDQVKNWLKAQSNYTNGWLEKIQGRNDLFNDFKKLDALKTFDISVGAREANRYFYKKTYANEKVGKIYYREGKDGKEVLLYDPSADAKGKSVSITFYVPSKDGKKLALGIAEGGGEIATIYIMDVDT